MKSLLFIFFCRRNAALKAIHRPHVFTLLISDWNGYLIIVNLSPLSMPFKYALCLHYNHCLEFSSYISG